MAHRPRIVKAFAEVTHSKTMLGYAKHLNQERFDYHYIVYNPEPSPLEAEIEALGIPVHSVAYTGNWKSPALWWQGYRLLRKLKPAIVHTEMPTTGILLQSAARLQGVRHRLHTRHHSTMHWDYYPKGVWLDKMVSRLTTKQFCISKAQRTVLEYREHVPTSKLVDLPHGMELQAFVDTDAHTIAAMREKYVPAGKQPVIGTVARFITLKGLNYVIEAVAELKQEYPNIFLMMANAKGDAYDEIVALLEEKLPGSYGLVAFEPDVPSLYKLLDVYVHVPIDADTEAFGQTYVEALALEVPSVFTLSGIANEFIEDGRNALVVPFKDAPAIAKAIKQHIEHPEAGKAMARQGKQDVFSRYSVQQNIRTLEATYARVLGLD